ncbi:hypothetical protein LTR66_006452 [Elasticomyces elasticus]|nr:hypothetical protein LTR66_006452 [Elasticomyces elasticus]
MAPFVPRVEGFDGLRDKVLVITGGANGIGAATVRLFHDHGALVVFGDTAVGAGQALSSSLGDRATFVSTDVTDYAANVTLFKTAFQKYGKIDHAVSCAGIMVPGADWFDDLSIESVEQPLPDIVLDVNLKAVAYFARVAVAYLKHRGDSVGGDSAKSLTFTSSDMIFCNTRRVPLYQVRSALGQAEKLPLNESPGLTYPKTSKSGVLTLARTLSTTSLSQHGVRVNTLLPNMTATQMWAPLLGLWHEQKLPVNQPEDLARFFAGLAMDEKAHGLAIAVTGGEGWDIEAGLRETMPTWCGPERAEALLAVGRLMG